MASTFANASAFWRVRTGGNELNGGCFDPYVTNVGTDYSDQDSPQLSLSDLVTAGVSANITSATGGFTAAMIGNGIRIASGTNFTADYYIITAVADTNNATVDRNCATGVGVSGVCRIGGAHASLVNYATSATVLSTPALATPLIPGNRIYIRGAGTEDPSSNDYDWSAGKWVFPSGNKTSAGGGPVTLIGYNGRPRIGHSGSLITANWDIKHVSVFRVANTVVEPIASGASNTVLCTMTDCIIDQNGFDAPEYYAQYGGFFYNEVRNTGGGSAGTKEVISVAHPGCAIIGNYVHGVRGPAVTTRYASASGQNSTSADICYNTIVNCLSDGIVLDGSQSGTAYNFSVFNNTLDANGGNGINFINTGVISQSSVFNNIISNHVGSGKFAMKFVDSYTLNRRLQRNVFDANCFYGNTTKFNTVSSADAWVLQTNDITTDPGYVNAAGGNYATGTNVRSKGLSGLGGVGGTLGTATNLINIGAFQGAAAGSTLTGATMRHYPRLARH